MNRRLLLPVALAAFGCGEDEIVAPVGGEGGATSATSSATTTGAGASGTTMDATSVGVGGAGGEGGQGGESACPTLELGATSIDFASIASYGLQVEVGAPLPDVARTRLTLELYEDEGAPPLETGTFDLTEPPNDNYGTCQHCVLLVGADATGQATRAFFQTSGSMTLTDLGFDERIVAGEVSGVVVQEVTQNEDLTWELLPDGACFTIPTWTFDTTPVDGGDCQRVEECPNEAVQVCDPATAKCVPTQCDLNFDGPFCDAGELCFSQLVPLGAEPFGPASGACYEECDPAGPETCPAPRSCYALGPTQAIGVCLGTGSAEVGEACPSPDISTGCEDGAVCDGYPGACAESCTYLTATSGCDAGTHCAVDNICRAPEAGDPAAIGGECDEAARFLGDCGVEGDAFRGLCLSFFLGDPLLCERLCRIDEPACPGDELCVSIFSNPDVGICRAPADCGDGLLDVILGEACDDGNELDGDGCSADCTTTDIAAFCGDAPPLTLDVPNVGSNVGGPTGYTSACDPFVVMPTDSFQFLPEAPGTLTLRIEGEVDFGVSVLGDCADSASELGCGVPLPVGQSLEVEIASVPVDPLLVVVRGSSPLATGAFTLEASFDPSACGDGDIGGPEACDDGNEVDGDGCSADCLVVDWDLVCGGLPTLELEEVVSSDTTGGTQFFDTGGFCATASGGGLERAYRFVAGDTGQYRFLLTQPADDLVVWIGDGCSAPSWDLFAGCGNASPAGELETGYAYLEEGQEVTVVVEGMREADVGAFTLTAVFDG